MRLIEGARPDLAVDHDGAAGAAVVVVDYEVGASIGGRDGAATKIAAGAADEQESREGNDEKRGAMVESASVVHVRGAPSPNRSVSGERSEVRCTHG